MVLGALVRAALYAGSARGRLGSLATILIAGTSISLPESEGGGRAVARPPPQPGELRYAAWAAA
jgi:hypothetical protein